MLTRRQAMRLPRPAPRSPIASMRANPATFCTNPSRQEILRNSPSVIDSKPRPSCQRTTAATCSSSSARRAAGSGAGEP